MLKFYYLSVTWPDTGQTWTETTNSMGDVTCVTDSSGTIVYDGTCSGVSEWAKSMDLSYACHEGNLRSYLESIKPSVKDLTVQNINRTSTTDVKS